MTDRTPIALMKSVKNEVEIAGMRNAHVSDSLLSVDYLLAQIALLYLNFFHLVHSFDTVGWHVACKKNPTPVIIKFSL